MVTSVPAPDQFITSFPNDTLPQVADIPTYKALKELKSSIKENATSIPSKKGGGQHGYLSIVLSPAAYANISGTPFIVPLYPGATPNIQQIVQNHEERLRECRKYNNVQKALKEQLLTAINSNYVQVLKDPNTRFNNITVRQILYHLFQTYGKITPYDLEENEKGFKAY